MLAMVRASALVCVALGAMLWLSLATFLDGGAFGLAGAVIGLLIGLREHKARLWAGLTGALIGLWIGLGVAGLAMG